MILSFVCISWTIKCLIFITSFRRKSLRFVLWARKFRIREGSGRDTKEQTKRWKIRRTEDIREMIERQILMDIFRVLLLIALVVHYRHVSQYNHTADYIPEPGRCDKTVLILAFTQPQYSRTFHFKINEAWIVKSLKFPYRVCCCTFYSDIHRLYSRTE